MPPELDLSRTKHPLVVPSRISLRRNASYEKQPTSTSSSRFNFNHLVFSPPPSPGLPALVPRTRKPSNTPRPSKVLRLVVWVLGIVAILYCVSLVLRDGNKINVAAWSWHSSEEFEMVGQYDLPEFPTPIAVTDHRGRSKWTVSIPPSYDFPLSLKQYSDICAKCHEVAAHVRELHGQSRPSQQAQLDYYYQDPYFVDVFEAQQHGLLPAVETNTWQVAAQGRDGHLVGEQKEGLVEQTVCKSSMTYVMESQDAGLGNTLMMLWLAYGLAEREGRSFFIDDSRWAYGGYTGIFKAPPTPGCRPPPRHEMLPCPHHARHLIVSAATAVEVFGRSFAHEFEKQGKRDIDREKPMYDLARRGHDVLFQLNKDDQPYVDRRVKELRERMDKVVDGKSGHTGTIVGVHVRRGDLHPLEIQYSGSYMPFNLYTEAAREIVDDHYNSTVSNEALKTAKKHSMMILASDDPEVYEAEEFVGASRAQGQIKLASKTHIENANPDKSVMHKFVEEAFGWEGGFFASMFWNLGRSTLNSLNAADPPTTTLPPSAETMRLRELIGRAYMMDLAVLGQASDVVICTVSAGGCRLLAVMMGWEKAMEKGNWVNIDGNYGWTGVSP